MSFRFTGFTPQAEEEREPQLDLAALLVRRPAITFYALMAGDAMSGANIHDGDLLVIEPAERYAHGQLVLAFVDGTTLVRRLSNERGQLALQAANTNYSAIPLDNDSGWSIRGRVVASITFHRPPTVALPKVS